MRSENYGDLLLEKEWIEFKNKIHDRDKHKCIKCGSYDKLEAHHTFYYFKNTLPWLYPEDSVISLCRGCHQDIHDNSKTPLKSIEYLENIDSKSYCDKNGKYEFDIFKFKSKPNFIKFCRFILDSYQSGFEIVEDNIIYKFVSAIYDKHPNKIDSKIIKIVVETNDEYQTSNNFTIYFENGDRHQFSNKKCIDNY